MKYYQALFSDYLSSINRNVVYGELYTEKEFSKFGLNRFEDFFRKVEISQRKVYWFFGVRFVFHDHPMRLTDCERFQTWR